MLEYLLWVHGVFILTTGVNYLIFKEVGLSVFGGIVGAGTFILLSPVP